MPQLCCSFILPFRSISKELQTKNTFAQNYNMHFVSGSIKDYVKQEGYQG